MAAFLWLFVMVLACLIIWRASDGFETASVYLGRNLREGVRGATINAIGSSVPELFTTIFFLLILHNEEGLSGGIGTTAGSAIFNAMVIPAAVILAVLFLGKVKFVNVSRKVIIRDGIMLFLSELIFIFILVNGTVTKWHGLMLMLLYGAYMVVLFATMKKNEKEVNEDIVEDDVERKHRSVFSNLFRLDLVALHLNHKELNVPRAWGLLLLSTLVIGAASALLVFSSEELGSVLQIPVYFIAVILVAAATSVPDTIISIRDAKKGNYDDAVSNALGSNIFDICFALGLPVFFYTLFYGPIKMEDVSLIENVNELRILLLILTSVVFFVFLFSKKLKLFQSFILMAVYVVFIVFILGKSMDATWVNPIVEGLEAITHFIKYTSHIFLGL